MSDCLICTEPFNKSTRKPIKCLYCNIQYCYSCCKNYVITVKNPICMNPECQSEWNNEFIQSNFTLTFYKGDFRRHQEEVYSDREKARFPEMQRFLEASNVLNETTNSMDNELNHIQKCKEELRIRELLYSNLKRKHQIYTRLYNGENISIEELQQLEDSINSGQKIESDRNLSFIQACKAPDCRGFLSTKWVCTVCNSSICPECEEVKRLGPPQKNIIEPQHVCDPNILENVKMIKKDSKNCPKCASKIYRVSGCAQMWCTMCKVAFDWRTLSIITKGTVHNPHYYEWMRRHDRDVNFREEDNLCNQGVPNYNDLHHQEKNFNKYQLSKLLRFIQELEDGIIRPRVPFPDREYNKIRLEYLRNSINDEEFKKNIYNLEKRIQKDFEYRQIIELLVHVATDQFRNWLKNIPKKSSEEYENFAIALFNLFDYVNQQLKEYTSRWGIPQKSIIFRNTSNTLFFEIKTVHKKTPNLPMLIQLGIKVVSTDSIENSIDLILNSNSIEEIIRKYIPSFKLLFQKEIYLIKNLSDNICNSNKTFEKALVLSTVKSKLKEFYKTEKCKNILEKIIQEANDEKEEILKLLNQIIPKLNKDLSNEEKTKEIIDSFKKLDFIKKSKNDKRCLKQIEDSIQHLF